MPGETVHQQVTHDDAEPWIVITPKRFPCRCDRTCHDGGQRSSVWTTRPAFNPAHRSAAHIAAAGIRRSSPTTSGPNTRGAAASITSDKSGKRAACKLRTSWPLPRILIDSLIMKWRLPLFVVTVVVIGPLLTDVAAQGAEIVRLTGAAVVAVHNPGEGGSASDIGPGFGGSAPGLVVGLQVPVGSGRRAIFEIGLERSIHGNQSGRSALWLTTHRDTTFSGLYAWTKDETARVTPTIVGGVTFALRHTVREAVLIRNLVRPTSTRGSLDDQVLGLTGGLDIPVRVSTRLFITPTLRFHWLWDGDRNGDGTVRRGIGPFVTRVGVALGVGL
jgi:hypothetical protein